MSVRRYKKFSSRFSCLPQIGQLSFHVWHRMRNTLSEKKKKRRMKEEIISIAGGFVIESVFISDNETMSVY